MKKLFSILLTFAMLLSMSTLIFADNTTTITVASTNNHKYNVYQIFTGDLDISSKTLSNIKWGANAKLPTGKSVGDPVDAATLAALGTVAGTGITDEAKLVIIKQYVDLDSTPVVSGVNNTSAANVPYGYYLFVDVTETLPAGEDLSTYVVQLVGPTEITVKYGSIIPEKKVKDKNDSTGETSGWQDSADYDIGDDVPFRLSGTISEKYSEYTKYYYCFHDTLSTGLTFNNDVVVKVVNGSVETTLTTGYTVTFPASDGCTFDVEFVDLKTITEATINENSKIVVEYTAKLNEGAVIGSAGNDNKMDIEYSNNPNNEDKGKTPEDKVRVYTYKLVINKIDGTTKQPLKGAGFTLYKKGADNTYTAVGTELKGADMTTFEWKGLDDGEYKLVETTTPPGYNTMDDIIFTITANHDTTSDDPKITYLSGGEQLGEGNIVTGTISKDIENNAGTKLPETGAAGTMMFIGFGSLLVMAATVFMITRKKMSVYKD